jgi:hypothetical protein
MFNAEKNIIMTLAGQVPIAGFNFLPNFKNAPKDPPNLLCILFFS